MSNNARQITTPHVEYFLSDSFGVNPYKSRPGKKYTKMEKHIHTATWRRESQRDASCSASKLCGLSCFPFSFDSKKKAKAQMIIRLHSRAAELDGEIMFNGPM